MATLRTSPVKATPRETHLQQLAYWAAVQHDPTYSEIEAATSDTDTQEPARRSVNVSEQWLKATEATKIANNLTGVGRSWSSYWRRFCEQHGVPTRPAQTKSGQPTEYRRAVEMGSFVGVILQNPDQFDKPTPEREKRRQAIMEKIRLEHGFNADLRNELMSRD